MTTLLAGVFRAPSSANAHIVRGVSAMFALALVLLSFVVYRSVHSPDPVVLTDVVALINHESLTGNSQLIETRRFIGRSEETLGTARELFSESEPTTRIALEGGLFVATKGPFTSTNVITLPQSIRGRWCLKTAYTWWPSWSQREFQMDTPVVCFETTPNA